MKTSKLALFSGIAAHILAWIAFLFLALWPYLYQGVAITAEGSIRTSASLIAVNGFRIVPILLTPVLITGFGLAVLLFGEPVRTRKKVFLWVDSALLAIFCALGIFSIGIIYFPSAIAIIVAATAYSRTKNDFASARLPR